MSEENKDVSSEEKPLHPDDEKVVFPIGEKAYSRFKCDKRTRWDERATPSNFTSISTLKNYSAFVLRTYSDVTTGNCSLRVDNNNGADETFLRTFNITSQWTAVYKSDLPDVVMNGRGIFAAGPSTEFYYEVGFLE
ncbi:hypothetical protein SAMN05444064_10420 [Pseudomonas syringae]|uniref:hypothetical protein n=1 Tax=Pseudomonas syringae TaxID=317 RepID=UPI00089CDF4F|nr:hypothetical protein [Pseudomonas syringae]SDW48594.1 hypothetical protein SAMN05444514_10420 [Pseudomonas syringae]SFL75002.1 hypothetical protein SAMN05444064_10420 [Pseudomonas syringae]